MDGIDIGQMVALNEHLKCRTCNLLRFDHKLSLSVYAFTTVTHFIQRLHSRWVHFHVRQFDYMIEMVSGLD